MFRNKGAFSPEIKAKFDKWLDCADEVKDANRTLQIKESMKSDAAEELTLRQIGATIAKTTWTLLVTDPDGSMDAYINKSTQRRSASTIQVQSLRDYKSVKISFLDYKIVDCDLGTINNVEGATSLQCDGGMCKTPTALSKNKPSAPTKPPPGSFNGLFVEAICKTR